MRMNRKNPISIIKRSKRMNTYIQCSQINYYQLTNIIIEGNHEIQHESGNTYKLLKTREIKINDETIHQLIDYNIPTKSGSMTNLPFHTVHYHTNITGNASAKFKEIAKIYRYLKSTIPEYLQDKINIIQANNPNFTLETLMDNINTLLVTDKIKQLIIKAIHNAIYVADWATNYQSVTLGMKHWAPEKIYPTICVLHDAALDVTTSVDHEFFSCSRIASVWEFTYTIINKMIGHDGHKPRTWNETLSMIHDIGDSPDVHHVLNINVILLTLKTVWGTYHQKMIWYQEGVSTADLVARCDAHLTSHYKRRVVNEICMTPHHAQAIAKYARHKGNDRRAADARDLIFRPFEPVDVKNLSSACEII